MLLMYGQCYHLSRYQNAAAASREYAGRFPEKHHPGPRQLLIKYSGEIDRTGLKIVENNKKTIISVNTNILLRRFRLKFLRIIYSTSCYKVQRFSNCLQIHLNLVTFIYCRTAFRHLDRYPFC
jgi:hypothetical protein